MRRAERSRGRKASRWTLRLHSATHEIRRGAIRSLALRSLSAIYQACGLYRWYLRVYLYETSREPGPIPFSEISLSISELDPSQLSEYQRYRPDQDLDEVQRRLIDGERCFVGRAEGRIVCEAWWVAQRVHVERLYRTVELAPDALWAKYSFVLPELRGRNVDTLRGNLTRRQLWSEGYFRCYFSVLPHNASALGSAAKWGAHRIGTLGFLRVGRFRLDFERLGVERVRWAVRPVGRNGHLRLGGGTVGAPTPGGAVDVRLDRGHGAPVGAATADTD